MHEYKITLPERTAAEDIRFRLGYAAAKYGWEYGGIVDFGSIELSLGVNKIEGDSGFSGGTLKIGGRRIKARGSKVVLARKGVFGYGGNDVRTQRVEDGRSYNKLDFYSERPLSARDVERFETALSQPTGFESTEHGFHSPALDFFRHVPRFFIEEPEDKRYSSVQKNDATGAYSLVFSEDAVFNGNLISPGGVLFWHVPRTSAIIGIDNSSEIIYPLDNVARIRNKDNVVWENPKLKKRR